MTPFISTKANQAAPCAAARDEFSSAGLIRQAREKGEAAKARPFLLAPLVVKAEDIAL